MGLERDLICESGLRDDAPVRGGKASSTFLERSRGCFHAG